MAGDGKQKSLGLRVFLSYSALSRCREPTDRNAIVTNSRNINTAIETTPKPTVGIGRLADSAEKVSSELLIDVVPFH